MKKQYFIENLSQLFDDEIFKMRKETEQPDAYFRASGIMDCPRAMLFTLLNLPEDKYPPKERENATSYKLMRRGTDDHTFTQKVLIHMGLMTENDMEDAKRILVPDLLFSGHPDGILTFDDERVLLELKTINDRGWKYIKEPKESHFYQAQAYIHFIKEQYNIDLTGVLFIYINRENDEMPFKTFWVDKNEDAINLIVNKLKVMKQYLQKGEIYGVPEGYNPDDSTFIPCRWCPFNTPEMCKSNKTRIKDFAGSNIIADFTNK